MILLFFVIESFLSDSLKLSLQLENELQDTQIYDVIHTFYLGEKFWYTKEHCSMPKRI